MIYGESDIEALIEERDTAKAQLAEAVALLDDPVHGYTHGWYPSVAKKVAEFLARYAQAEQPEAKLPISHLDVRRLRDATGHGIVDCRKALTKTNNDHSKAVEYLRKLGQC